MNMRAFCVGREGLSVRWDGACFSTSLEISPRRFLRHGFCGFAGRLAMVASHHLAVDSWSNTTVHGVHVLAAYAGCEMEKHRVPRRYRGTRG